jgi:hypothetical protein
MVVVVTHPLPVCVGPILAEVLEVPTPATAQSAEGSSGTASGESGRHSGTHTRPDECAVGDDDTSLST